MHTVIRWSLYVVAGLLMLVVGAAAALFARAQAQINRAHAVQPVAVTVPTDQAALARGQHLADSFLGCTTCHGHDLAGGTVFNDPALGVVHAPNLTAGQGGVGAAYTDADWVRALRHGVGGDGRALAVMPSQFFHNLSAGDLGAVIAYVKSAAPVDRAMPPARFTVLGKVLIGAGVFGNLYSAEIIDHANPPPARPAPGVTPAYGAYLVSVSSCRTCHGAGLAGGRSPDPNAPPAPDLTTSGPLAAWTEADFVRTLQTGVTPEGRALSVYMPWPEYSRATEAELQAVWAYVRTLPAER